MTFEGPYRDYDAALRAMPWCVRDLPPGRTAHLVYDATREQALLAAGRGATGHLYVTEASASNPWNALPPYLDQLEGRLLARCA